MKYSKLFVSLIASSLLLCAEDSEVQVSFSGSASDTTHKIPTWNPPFDSNQNFSWDQEKGLFIINATNGTSSPPSPPPPYDVTATFKSDQKNEGILTLKNFNLVNGYKNGSLALPKEENLSSMKFGTSITIKNGDGTSDNPPFKGFTLGSYQNSTGTINLYSGTNLKIEDFQQTTFRGSIYVRSGSTKGLSSSGSETTLYTSNDSSLSVVSTKDYSTFDMGASLNLETNNNDKTKEKAVASFSSDIKGNTKISGSVYIADKAVASFKTSNIMDISSSINVYAQEVKKITQDSLGNQSVAQEDITGAKKTNLTLEATKINLTGSIYIGTGAKELVTKVDSNGITKIDTYATDIGSKAEIVADIVKKGITNPSTTDAPQDWSDAQKAQFVQSGGLIRIGMNSDVMLRSRNYANVFNKDDPYAITITSVYIEEQKKGNTLLNFDAQAQITTARPAPSGSYDMLTKEGAGKILLNGSFDLYTNARALVQAYDGIDTGESARFTLYEDSLLWLKGKEDDGLSLELKGTINANGGALVLGDVYQGSTTADSAFETKLVNLSSTTISNSMRSTTEQAPTRPPVRGVDNATDSTQSRDLDPAGVFLLGKSNTFDNQGTLTFDGGGNLTTMTTSNDSVIRDLSIINSTNKKGAIQAKGANNIISSSGSLTLISQDISLSTKTLDDENKTTQEGELILYSSSLDSSSYIQLGSQTQNSGKDKISVSGGTLKIASQIAGVQSYNLRLTKANLDLTSLAYVNQMPQDSSTTARSTTSSSDTTSSNAIGSGAFVNLRKLELGGAVNIYVSDSAGIIANGNPPDSQEKVSDFQENLPTIEVQGSNQIISKTQNPVNFFSFDNHGILNLKSSSSLYVGGDINHSGSLVYSADQFGIGTLKLKGDFNLDMSNHQESGASVNPLIAINHSNFYSLTLNQVYMLVQSEEGSINYRVGSALLKPTTQGDAPTPRSDSTSSLTYTSQQSLLKTEIEDYLNGENAYEGNENKLGIFLNGVALIGENYIGFGVTRSDAISQISIDGSATGVIDQYMEILQGSDGTISEKKTQEMLSAITSSDPKAMQALNNALEAQNGLELGILKDIGSYNSASLVTTASQIQQAMRTITDISRPVIEDFRKMKIIREIAVQNRMVRSSNPYTAEMELEQIVGEMSPNFEKKQSQDTQSSSNAQNDTSLDAPTPFLFDDRIAFKNSFWLSVITSTSKTSLDNSSLYGMSLGYEYMPIPNILLGVYTAYGYSNYKADTLKNSAHNLDLTAYARLYYGASEFDITFSYIHGFNEADTQLDLDSLNQSFSFGTDSFDLNLRYGYIFKTPLKGFFLKPVASFTFYGIGLPTLIGEGSANSIILEEQMQGGMEFGLGLELRQYLSAFSYIYLLPSLEYNLYQSDLQSNIAFVGATNKMNYALSGYGKWDFSLYAGGEGYVNQAFSINVSAGYRGALDAQEHNLSISAGLKYKF